MEDESVASKNKKLFKMMKESTSSDRNKNVTEEITEGVKKVELKAHYDSDDEKNNKKNEVTNTKSVTMESEDVDPYYPSHPLFSVSIEGKKSNVVVNEYSEKSIAIYIIGE